MRLRALLLADHASTDAAGKLFVSGGGITRLIAPLPSQFPFLTFVAHYVVEPADVGQTHRASIRILDPEGTELGEIPPASFGPLERKGEPGEDQTYTVAVTIGGLPLQLRGRYEFEIAINDEAADSLGVMVVPPPSEES
jgi:hypothetical protein